METQINLRDHDDLDQRIATATRGVLKEFGLSERVKIRGVEQKQGEDRYAIGLAEQTAPKQTAYHHFYLDPREVVDADHGSQLSVAEVKPYVRREVEKLFPNSSTQE